MSSPPRHRWTCGEASWLTEIAGVTDLRATLGYPLRFTARQTIRLIDAGITPEQAQPLDDADVQSLPDVRGLDPRPRTSLLPQAPEANGT